MIVWVSQAAWQDNEQLEMNGVVVDLKDAALLAGSADQWRSEYTIAYRQSEETDHRIQRIREWLPTKVDWQTVEGELRTTAASSNLKATSVFKGAVGLGERAGVLSTTCELEGDYSGLCDFLHRLANQPAPIACSEIRLQRSLRNPEFETNAEQPEIRATLALRIPYAVADSFSGRLLTSGGPNNDS
jgi:hypothetical protein